VLEQRNRLPERIPEIEKPCGGGREPFGV